MAKSDANPMNPVHRLQSAPRCHATAKSSGVRCKCPAVRGWRVCRVHGARGGHEAGPTHPRWRHGGRSREVTVARSLARLLSDCSTG
jgi:hypothetical protein